MFAVGNMELNKKVGFDFYTIRIILMFVKMRRLFKNLLLWGSFGIVTLNSCAYENEEELFGSNPCQPEITTYSAVIQPIIADNCNVPTCHDGSNSELPNFTILENLQNNLPLLRNFIITRTMPPSNSGKILTAAQIDDITCWIDSGAQNN